MAQIGRILASLRVRLVLLVLIALLPAGFLIFQSAQDRRMQDLNRARMDAQEVAYFAARQYELSIESTRLFLLPLAEIFSHRYTQFQVVRAPEVAILRTASTPGSAQRGPPSETAEGLDCRRFVAAMIDDDPRLTSLRMARPTGEVICSSAPATTASEPHPDFVARIAETRSFVVGVPQKQPGKDPTIHAGLPIAGSDGGTIGILYVSHDLQTLGSALAETDLPPGSSVTVVSGFGEVLAQFPPSPTSEVGERLASTLDYVNMTGHPDGFSFDVDGPGGGALVAGVGLGPFTSQGASPDGTTAPAFVAVTIPRSAAYSRVEQQLGDDLRALALVALLAGLAAWAGGEILLRHVWRYASAARAITDGNFDIRTGPPYPRNELGQLGRAFDNMAAAVQRRNTEIQALNQTLESRVIERTAALEATNADLLEARLVAERASEAKSEFLSNMSHELRTPLNAVIGFSSLLAEGKDLPDREHRYIQNISDAGHHLLGLINDVLDIARVEAGKTELNLETADLSTVIDPALEATWIAATARQVEFMTNWAECTVTLDVGRFRQILHNLLSNAVKFTPEGGRVTLTLAAEGSTLRVDVADTGMGIPESKRDRVFGLFERLHDLHEHKIAGTGLGLAITRNLVELQHGSIWFESVEGEGTTFHVELPGVVGGSLDQSRLLVVEDERGSAELVIALAKDLGITCEVASTGARAIASITRARPRAMVLDLSLPDMRGERVLEVLKSQADGLDVPVVVISVEDDTGASRRLGADDHITKPVDHARLQAWLRLIQAKGDPVESASG